MGKKKKERLDLLHKTRELKHMLYHETLHALNKSRSGEAVIYNKAVKDLSLVEETLQLRLGHVTGKNIHVVDEIDVGHAEDE